jgi:hypothetical protein
LEPILGFMGFKRSIGRAALLSFVTGTTVAHAVPDREPLVVETLPVHLVAANGSGGETTLDDKIAQFEGAVAQAALVERQEMATRCKSATAAAGPSRWAWEAHCRYQRR